MQTKTRVTKPDVSRMVVLNFTTHESIVCVKIRLTQSSFVRLLNVWNVMTALVDSHHIFYRILQMLHGRRGLKIVEPLVNLM